MERKWIEHDGSGCPVPVGTPVEARQRNGVVICHAITQAALNCGAENRAGRIRRSIWAWAVNGRREYLCYQDIIAWRRHDTPEAEQAHRAARMDMFNGIAKEAVKPLVRQ